MRSCLRPAQQRALRALVAPWLLGVASCIGDAPPPPTPDVLAVDATYNDLAPPDVADVRDVADAPPAWGLDERPRNTTCVAFARPVSGTGVTVTRAFPRMPAAFLVVALAQAPGDPTRWFQLEKTGRIYAFRDDPSASTRALALDISARVESTGELGLLGIAFHPSFATNRQVFLSYTGYNRVGGRDLLVSRISRFRSTDGVTIDPASEEVIMAHPRPGGNHAGGNIAFGPDGYLYAGYGDGGVAPGPMNQAQDTSSLLGKFLRIDVDHPTSGRAYGIPTDNPFASGVGGAPEVYAWGMRNPWRWSIDGVTGDLWAGDVGATSWEEVDQIRRGGNYGWPTMEGDHCYGTTACDRAGLTPPVVEYDRSLGSSVTGGFVYRGTRIPWLVGSFVFGDYGTGRVWRVAHDAMGAPLRQQIVTADIPISTFAQDAAGELYAVRLIDGLTLRIDPGPATAVDTVPPTLRATGCVDATDPTRPAEGLIPYAPNAPFWSDGADKERYMALPEGGRITVGVDGDWDLPVGSVLVKTFSYGGRRIETRLLVRHVDGDWAGYTYRWNDAQTDAVALVSSDARDLGGGVRWLYPNRAQCLGCHTQSAGRTLGLETAQLNGEIVYPSTGRTANQLATLARLGLFTAPLPGAPEALPRIVSPTGSAPLELRARAYLHVNCAQCHRPGGTARGTADFLYATPASRMGVCDAAPTAGDLGVTGARLVAPGAPSRSIVSLRMHATDARRMPPIAAGVVDVTGAALVDGWIASLRACP